MFRSVVLTLVLLMTGCAVFDGNNLPDTSLSSSIQTREDNPTLSYSIVAMGGMGNIKELPHKAQVQIDDEFKVALEDSGYFSQISKRDETVDLKVTAILTDSANPAALVPAFITGLTLYLVPSWAKNSLQLDATVESSNGQSKTYVIEDSATIVQWLPMIFVFPFNNFSVLAEVRTNMYLSLLNEMEKDGFF